MTCSVLGAAEEYKKFGCFLGDVHIRRTAGSTVDTCSGGILDEFSPFSASKWTSDPEDVEPVGCIAGGVQEMDFSGSGLLDVLSPNAWFDRGYKFVRPSTVTPGRNSHSSHVKVISDPEVGHSSCAMPG